MEYLKYQKSRLGVHLLSMPFIWLPLPFIILLDLVCSLYQYVCFPLYKIKLVKRAEYILIFDRNKLKYLHGPEKLGCMYCGYANGSMLYLKAIAGLTEKYWCGIMHENKSGFKVQADQVELDFARFGDEQDFNAKYKND